MYYSICSGASHKSKPSSIPQYKFGSIPFFGNLSGHCREGDVVIAAQCKNSLLLYAVQTVQKMVDIFTGDRELEECP
jgi:hypothetical protein